jgi:RpiB/LacA/LacB family sugar-phosphate isomerase
MRVGIGADHGGFRMKEQLAKLLTSHGHKVIDFGNTVFDPDDDYPDFAIPLAQAVANGRIERGILVCCSGVGPAVAANKVNGVRAALCHDDYSARQGVEDVDMNILCLGGQTTGIAVAWDCTKNFLSATFSEEPRHRRRLERVKQLEQASIVKLMPL